MCRPPHSGVNVGTADRPSERMSGFAYTPRVDFWFDYRRVWAGHPWLLVYFVIVLAVFGLAIYGTVVRDPLAILFIPALGGLYVHHMMVMKRVD
jgi:hypothetical protein